MALCKGTDIYRHDLAACGVAPCPLCKAFRAGVEAAARYMEDIDGSMRGKEHAKAIRALAGGREES